MGGFDPTLFSGDLTPAVLFGALFFVVRFAISQADKRAGVAEEREKVCAATLAATVPTMNALTAEVKRSGEDASRRLDSGLVRLEAIERGGHQRDQRISEIDLAIREILDFLNGDLKGGRR